MSVKPMTASISWMLIFACSAAAAATDETTTVQQLRQELEQLRTEYETRMATLERRLNAAERAADASGPGGASATSNRAFNPAISLILGGSYVTASNDNELRNVPGFQLGGETGAFDQGLLLGESELTLSANIDDKFYAASTIALETEAGETEVAVEEAYLQTLGLPGGLTMKAGQFFSGIGYHNGFHSHATSFVDAPLPYQVLLGGRYADAGMQTTWTAPTVTYLQLGAEIFSGNAFPAAGAADKGTGAWSAFAKLGGDFNSGNSWLASLSYLSTDVLDRPGGGAAGESGPDPLFSGSSDTWIGSLTWKWSPNGNPRNQNLRVSAEYLSREEHGQLDGGGYRGDQRGYYLEGVYRFHPQWRTGVRYDAMKSDNVITGLAGPIVLADDTFEPSRYSLMLDFSNSEFSTLRLQYVLDESAPLTDRRWILQYIMSMGAHGSHSF